MERLTINDLANAISNKYLEVSMSNMEIVGDMEKQEEILNEITTEAIEAIENYEYKER